MAPFYHKTKIDVRSHTEHGEEGRRGGGEETAENCRLPPTSSILLLPKLPKIPIIPTDFWLLDSPLDAYQSDNR